MLYKFLSLIFLLVFITISAKSQPNKRYKKDSLQINKCPVDTVELYDNELKNNHQALITLPFSRFIFKDVRDDTNYIGGTNRRRYFLSKGFHKLNFNCRTDVAISRFLNDTVRYVYSKGNYELSCFVKQFRITQIDSMVDKNNPKKLFTTARIEIEAFLESDGIYYPALRFDTIASSFSARVKDISILRDLLSAFAGKAALIDSLNVLKRKAYSNNDITDRYQNLFNEPIIKDSVLHKGIYKTALEFLHNSPSIKDFEFNKQGVLYTKIENGEMVPTRDVYGFCDSERIWINVHKFFYPLIKQGRTFEFLADMNLLNEIKRPGKTIYVYHDRNEPIGESLATIGVLAIAALLVPGTYSSEFVYQLDVQTGEFY